MNRKKTVVPTSAVIQKLLKGYILVVLDTSKQFINGGTENFGFFK